MRNVTNRSAHSRRTIASFIGLALITTLVTTTQSSAAPILEYKFNETGTGAASTGTDATGVTMRDAAGVPTDLHGATGSGIRGISSDRAFDLTSATAMGFPGTGGYADQPDNAAIDGLSSVTVQTWYKASAALNDGGGNGNGARLFSNWASAGFDINNGLANGWTMYIDGDFLKNSDTVFTNADIGNWIFLAVTFDSASQQLRYYKGTATSAVVPAGTHTLAQGTLDNDTVGLVLGNYADPITTPRPFDGLLDNMRIFGSAVDSSGALDNTALEALRQADLIPEPTSFALLVAGALVCLRARRRFQH